MRCTYLPISTPSSYRSSAKMGHTRAFKLGRLPPRPNRSSARSERWDRPGIVAEEIWTMFPPAKCIEFELR